MHRLGRSFFIQGLIAFDLLAVAASLGMAVFVSATELQYRFFTDFLSVRVSVRNVLLIILFLFACHFMFDQCGLYRSRRLGSQRPVYGQTIKAVSIAALLWGVMASVFSIEAFRRSHLAVFWSAGVVLIAASRAISYRWVEASHRRGRNLRNVLVVGAGARGIRFAGALEAKPELGYRILGFLDDPNDDPPPNVKLMGSIGDLPRLLHAQPVDEVAVALPIKTFYSEASWIISVCERRGVLVRMPADLFEVRQAQVESEQFEDLSVLTMFTLRGSACCFLMKRLADLLVSAAALVVLAPLMAVMATAIRLNSAGPVFFQQLRVGQNGRRFRMWKFRTMSVDAEMRQAELEIRNEVRGAAFKIHDDPRVTRVGRWLRRSSLDELPQLINVLRGEMSLVGPRPLPVRDVDRLSDDWQRRRFSVRPGLTCLWQAGGRHTLSFEDWMRLDLLYVDNWSLLLDLKILLRTVPAVWSGMGAS